MYSTTQGEVKSDSGSLMEVCVARVRVSVIGFGRTMEDNIYDKTTNATDSVVTGVINITKVTAYMVEYGIGEA